jgi:hypothetical protein
MYTIHPLKVYNLVDFSIFRELCSHHLPILEHFKSQQSFKFNMLTFLFFIFAELCCSQNTLKCVFFQLLTTLSCISEIYFSAFELN